MKLEIDDRHLDEATRRSMVRLIERAGTGHGTSARVHMAGSQMDEVYKADWIKHLKIDQDEEESRARALWLENLKKPSGEHLADDSGEALARRLENVRTTGYTVRTTTMF